MISVLVSVSQTKLESAVLHALSAEPEFKLVASRDNAFRALPIALNLEPDLFLMEDTQDNHVIEILKRLTEKNTHTSVIILNGSFYPEKLLEYFRTGAYDVIPAHLIGETLSERLTQFKFQFLNKFTEEDLKFLHKRVYDSLLFDALISDTLYARLSSVEASDVHPPVPFPLDGWFRAVYISLHSEAAVWPCYYIYELRTLEDYLRRKLGEQFRSVAVIPGNVRLILIVYDSVPVGDLSDLCRELQDVSRKEPRISSSIELSFGIGICGEGAEGLKTAIQTARNASLVRFNEGYGHIISYDNYFGDRKRTLEFLTDAEKEKLTASVFSRELDTCIRIITDIFSYASAAEFVPKATAIFTVLSEAFEVTVTRQNELAVSQMEILQSMPLFLHLLSDSVQVERELKTWVIRCFRAMVPENNLSVPSRIAAAKQYIAENYLRELDLQQVADYVDLSVPYFCSEFHKACGTTFIKYINNLRLERAAERLLISEDKITEIAAQAGFQDVRHFSRLFRKKYGKTPSQYRSVKQEETG